MDHPVKFQFIEHITDFLLTLLAHSRRESKFDSRSGLDDPGLECVPKKIEFSTLLLRGIELPLIAVAVNKLGLTVIELKFALIQSSLNCL